MNLSAEARFVLDCAAAHWGGEVPDYAPRLDAALVRAIIRQHRLLPLMDAALSRSSGWPEDLRITLTELRRRSVRRTMALACETVRVVTALREAGIDALVVKGVAFAAQIHRSAVARDCRDIDLLLPAEQDFAARTVLDRLGYLTQEGAQHDNATGYWHVSGAICVEVHTRLTTLDAQLPMGMFQPFEAPAVVAIGNGLVPTLRPEAAVVYAAVHGTRHLWTHLYWIADMAAAVDCPGLDWAMIGHLARRMGVERPLGLGLVLARDLLRRPLPPPAATLAATVDRPCLRPLTHLGSVPALTERQAMRRMGLARFLIWYLTLHRRPSLWKAILVLHLRPSQNDRLVVALPRALDFLYLAIRPIRLLLMSRREH